MANRVYLSRFGLLAVLLVVLVAIVQLIRPIAVAEKGRTPKDVIAIKDPAGTAPVAKNRSIAVVRDFSKLPGPVAQMRDAILEAVRRGNIDELRYAIELNELKPDFGGVQGNDPIDGLRKASVDGKGRSVLAALGNLLDMPCAVIPVGPDVENAKLYVWPYLAELPLRNLTPAQEVDLYRLTDHKQVEALKASTSWRWWRLAIGADGVWHSFARGE